MKGVATTNRKEGVGLGSWLDKWRAGHGKPEGKIRQ